MFLDDDDDDEVFMSLYFWHFTNFFVIFSFYFLAWRSNFVLRRDNAHFSNDPIHIKRNRRHWYTVLADTEGLGLCYVVDDRWKITVVCRTLLGQTVNIGTRFTFCSHSPTILDTKAKRQLPRRSAFLLNFPPRGGIQLVISVNNDASFSVNISI